MTAIPLLLAVATTFQFLPRDEAIRDAATDLAVSGGEGLELSRTLRTDPGPTGGFGPAFASCFDPTLQRAYGVPGAVLIVDRGPCGQSGLAPPFASPAALAGAWADAAEMLGAAGESGPLAAEVAARAALFASDPVAARDAWLKGRGAFAVASAARAAHLDAPGCPVDHALELTAGFVRIEGRVRVRLHDAAGRLTLVADRRGASLRVVRDDSGRAIKLVARGGGAIDLGWEGERIVHARTSRGQQATYGYDAHGRLVLVTAPDGETRIAWHGDSERIASVQGPGGRFEIAYDDAGRPATLGKRGGDAEEMVWRTLSDREGEDEGETESYAYDRTGGTSRQVRITSTAWDAGASRTIVLAERFDPERGRVLVEETIEDEDGVVTETRFDPETARTVEIDRGSQVVRFRWDERGRLLERVGPEGRTELTYAAGGKVATVSRTSPDGTTTGVSFTYDAFDQVVAASASDGRWLKIAYDADGNIADAQTGGGGGGNPDVIALRFSYQDGRVARIEDRNGGAVAVSYGPDGDIADVSREGAGAIGLRVTTCMQRILDLTREATVQVGL